MGAANAVLTPSAIGGVSRSPSPDVHTDERIRRIFEGGQKERVRGSDAIRKRVNNTGPAANSESPGTEDAANSINESIRSVMPPLAAIRGSNFGINAAIRRVSKADLRRLSAEGCVSISMEDDECAGNTAAAAAARAAAVADRAVPAAIAAALLAAEVELP
jgi:hypothetical protein